MDHRGDPAGPAAIDIDGVTHSYGQRTVLDRVTLNVPAGRFLALIGPSGSGKSTLLHLVAGLTRPDAGEVRIGGEAVHTLRDSDIAMLRRHRLGFIFQAYNLIPVLTAWENVALPARLAGWTRDQTQRRVDELLHRMGIGHVSRQRPGQLSGGEQQRVAIARALLLRPGAVLADEPTGSLDAATGADVLCALRDLQAEEGTTVVMVTHDPVAASAADEVVQLTDGRISDRLMLDGWAPPERRDGIVEPEERSQLVLSWMRGRAARRERRMRAAAAIVTAP